MKAVFFDLFETLITEFSNGKRISNRNYDYKRLLGLEFTEFKKAWSSRSQKRMAGEYRNFEEVIKDILNEKQIPVKNEAIDYLYQERIKEKAIPFENIRPDMLELLQNLRNENFKLGLISNCTEEEVQSWHQSELAQYFDRVIFSYEAGIAKPDERIYLLACEKMSVTPEESFFVGDGGSNELKGAASVGMAPLHAFWFNTHVESPFKKIHSPSELADEIFVRTRKIILE